MVTRAQGSGERRTCHSQITTHDEFDGKNVFDRVVFNFIKPGEDLVRISRSKQATERAREALNLAMASQREEESLLAEGERRLAELTMEEKALPSPFQVTPDCKVNAELDQLRSEIARLRQQQHVRPVVGEANHIPVERQELESWMNHRAGDLRVAIEENNAARRLQLITLLAEGQRRLHSLEEEDAVLEEDFCATAPGEGRFAPY